MPDIFQLSRADKSTNQEKKQKIQQSMDDKKMMQNSTEKFQSSRLSKKTFERPSEIVRDCIRCRMMIQYY